MKDDILKAKSILKDSDYTCVFVNGKQVITSSQRGVKPLLDLIDSEKDMSSFSAADKIVGKAAAFLYVILGVRYVHADVMSQDAAHIFTQYNIDYSFGVSVNKIINRNGDGICPMEDAVQRIEDPKSALERIKKRLSDLQKTLK